MADSKEAGQSVDLERYRETGCLILEGKRAAATVTVVILRHAQESMKAQDIDECEVLQALEYPPSSHARRKDGRHEVAGMTDRGRLRVIYKRPTPDIVLVITAYPEPD